jgi:hypothetical protein
MLRCARRPQYSLAMAPRRVTAPGSRTRSRDPRNLLASTVGGLAFASVGLGLPFTVASLVSYHHEYGRMSDAQRDSAAGVLAGFAPRPWDFIKSKLSRGDNYALRLSADPRRNGLARETATYAAYWLLPAVAVARARDADVLVYVGVPAPRAADCFDRTRTTCVLRLHS